MKRLTIMVALTMLLALAVPYGAEALPVSEVKKLTASDGENDDYFGASVAVCRTTPEKQVAAWLFVKWFTETTRQARWVEASGYFPVRRSTARELEGYFARNPRYRIAFELLECGRAEPPTRRRGRSRSDDVQDRDRIPASFPRCGIDSGIG